MADLPEAASPIHVAVELPTSVEDDQKTRPPILHRVPKQLKENNKHIYDPVVLSLGPYHNRKLEQFRQVEEFKDELLNSILEPAVKGSFYTKILGRIDEIRIFYGGVSKEEHDDDALAQMMIRDACFLLYYMESVDDEKKWNHLDRRLGLSVVVFLYRDFFMLENQIPLWVLELLITLLFDDKDALIYNFISSIAFGDKRFTKFPWEGERASLHLLEANRRARIHEDISNNTIKRSKEQRIFKLIKWRSRRSDQNSTLFEMENSLFRSVTDLKAKGIHLRPSSYCLKDIRFNSYAFYGILQIPIWFVTNNTKVFFPNIIAFEMSPETDTNFEVLSYVNFMKSLIESPKDVKELREKRILFSTLRNDEEVMKIFKEIDTHGTDNEDNFHDIKVRINQHCDSKTKTWMAELTHSYFRSPWTTIALIASIFLLCLTFIQTYYTMPQYKGD